MKNLIFTLIISILFLTIPNTLKSQESPSETGKYVYCQIMGSNKGFSSKMKIQIDYGQEQGFFKDKRIKDEETGKVKGFNSMMDAMNYMSEEGWDFVQEYDIEYRGQIYYFFILRKMKE